ncbi:unnamed protein product [Urochloa humidicola]
MDAIRRRKLYTNTGERYGKPGWKHVAFEHPSTFETLAMDPSKKREIMDDLDAFRNGKEYYARVGKAWKRGYLLYGPPGTGKSSMIAAMANYLDSSTTISTTLSSRPCPPTPTSAACSSTPRASPSSSSRTSTAPSTSPASAATVRSRRQRRRPTPTSPSLSRHPAGEPTSKVKLSGVLNFIDGL